ncbi:hypothetical protein GCM10010363_60230 [Streptomyces omiyaensis]|nr:hypothetical protein GCM10010363_60230 [Streptomyces omiyaensis]
MHHRPFRIASAEHAMVTVAAAYEGATFITRCSHNPMNCPDESVRFGGYNGRVLTTNASASSPAAGVVAR